MPGAAARLGERHAADRRLGQAGKGRRLRLPGQRRQECGQRGGRLVGRRRRRFDRDGHDGLRRGRWACRLRAAGAVATAAGATATAAEVVAADATAGAVTGLAATTAAGLVTTAWETAGAAFTEGAAGTAFATGGSTAGRRWKS